jgi:poly(3-hydroxybutyrate) depolymerase
MSIRRSSVFAVLLTLLMTIAAACTPTKPLESALVVDGLHVSVHFSPRATAQPLVIALHGIGSTGSDFEKLTGLDAFADTHGFAIAYPDAHIAPDAGLPEPVTTPSPTPAPTPTLSPAQPVTASKITNFVEGAATTGTTPATTTTASGRAWDAGTICCGGSTTDDVAYLKHVVTAVAAKTKIDLHRVYVIGLSNGGMMALKAICDAPDVFAAAGSVAGPYLATTCARPVWIHLHGAHDPVVPYLGGAPPGSTFLHVPADWCGCSFPDSSTESARFSAFTVAVVRAPYGMHTWPKLGDGSWNVDGNTALWTFLSRFTL